MSKVRRKPPLQYEAKFTNSTRELATDRFLYVKLTDISPAPDNPRKHSRQQIRGIS